MQLKDIVKGDIFTKNNIRTFRPNKGLNVLILFCEYVTFIYL